MTDEKLNAIRKHEDAEIVRYLEAISEIIATKCQRCDSVLGCLGCIFSQGEMKGDIDLARDLVKKNI